MKHRKRIDALERRKTFGGLSVRFSWDIIGVVMTKPSERTAEQNKLIESGEAFNFKAIERLTGAAQ